MNYSEIHSFSEKYLTLYSDSSSTERDVCETFADECFALGFEMDCGHKFNDTYGSIYAPFDTVVIKVTDVAILASGIFSKWRYITHWSYCDQCTTDENRAWFIAAFAKLSELTQGGD